VLRNYAIKIVSLTQKSTHCISANFQNMTKSDVYPDFIASNFKRVQAQVHNNLCTEFMNADFIDAQKCLILTPLKTY